MILHFGRRVGLLILMASLVAFAGCSDPTSPASSGGGGGGITTEDVVGTWESSAGNTIVINDDGSATVSGDDYLTYSNASWEMETVEWTSYNMETGAEETHTGSGIGVYDEDDDGWFIVDVVFVETEDGELTLVDKDVVATGDEVFEKQGGADDTGDDTGDDAGDSDGDSAVVTGISFIESRSGTSVSWTFVDDAKSYMVKVNGEADSDLPITGSPYRLADVNDGDVITIEAFSDPNTTTLIATGTITYGDADGDTSDGDTSDGDTSDGDTGGATTDKVIATHSLPGTIEAEDFKNGGQGVGYFDNDEENKGDTDYRTGGVDIVAHAGASNGYRIGWMEADEGLAYDVSIPAGDYVIEVTYSGQGELKLVWNDSAVEPIYIEMSNTGSSDTYDTTTKSFTLPNSDDGFSVQVETPGFDLDKYEITEDDGSSDTGSGSFSLYPSIWERESFLGDERINISSSNIVYYYTGYGTSSQTSSSWTVEFDDSSMSGTFYESGDSVGDFTVSADGQSLTWGSNTYTKW